MMVGGERGGDTFARMNKKKRDTCLLSSPPAAGNQLLLPRSALYSVGIIALRFLSSYGY